MLIGLILLCAAGLATDGAKAGGQPRSMFPARGPYYSCDERIIEDRWQAERFVVPLERHPGNPLIVTDHPWEGSGPHIGGSVIRDPDDGLFKMWYSVWDSAAYFGGKRFSYNVCYAESRDGIAWEKPSLGVFSYRGSKDNNCIKLGRNKTQNIDVALNPWADSPTRKFVAIHNDSGGVFVSYSADGKTFDCSFSAPAVWYHSDTHNNFAYDEVAKRWLMFVRPRAYAGSRLKGVGRRRVAVKESADLESWTPERTVLVPGEGDPKYFYGMTVFRRGDLFFGVLQHYETVTHHLEAELVWSADSYGWHRLPLGTEKMLLKHGPAGAWDWGMVEICGNPVLVDDELWFYYGGSDRAHDQIGAWAIGLATAKRDRLIGVRSEAGKTGYVLTRPFKVEGDLRINAEARGSVRVEVHSALRDDPVPGWLAADCTPFTGDTLDAEVRWGDKRLSDLRGESVRLRFQLEDAALFAFDIQE